jgi:hypothetical protein
MTSEEFAICAAENCSTICTESIAMISEVGTLEELLILIDENSDMPMGYVIIGLIYLYFLHAT